LNQTELQYLTKPLHNYSRILYLLYFRPSANIHTGIGAAVSYKAIQELLNNGGADITLGREINEFIVELIAGGLLQPLTDIDDSGSLSGVQFRLPLILQESPQEIQTRFRLNKDWQPKQKTFNEIAQLVGIIQKEYSDTELGEFVAYWLGRPEQQYSEWQWTQKFVLHIRKTRQLKGYNPDAIVGYQQVKKQPEVVIDENTKKLIDKYHGKS